MNRIDRLFAILLVLQKRDVVRAEDLAARFEISKRTVYRDVAALSEMGVPVISLPGEGYGLMPGYSATVALYGGRSGGIGVGGAVAGTTGGATDHAGTMRGALHGHA